MEIDITHPIYRCKERELIDVSIKAWKNYSDHIVLFKKFSPFYTEDRAIQQISYIREIENRFYKTHNSTKEETQLLKDHCKIICQHWQLLKRYIQGAYPKKFHASKIKSAGIAYYFSAYRYNYSSLVELITQSTTFINHYKVILQLDQNMPESFHQEYIEACSAFTSMYQQYMSIKKEQKQFKYDKIKALNILYKSLMEILQDSKVILNNHKDILEKFSFTQLNESN
ncbi:MAG: hypothetical protein WCP57_03495 [Bacteroidota bacterium]